MFVADKPLPSILSGLKAQSNPTKEDLPIAQGKVSVANDTLGKRAPYNAPCKGNRRQGESRRQAPLGFCRAAKEEDEVKRLTMTYYQTQIMLLPLQGEHHRTT